MNRQKCAAVQGPPKALCPVCGKGNMVIVPLFAGLVFIARCSDARKCGTRTDPCSTADAARNNFEAKNFFVDD